MSSSNASFLLVLVLSRFDDAVSVLSNADLENGSAGFVKLNIFNT